MNSTTDWLEYCGRALKADPKKSGALAVLGSVLLVLLWRIALGGSGGAALPASAGAANVPPSVTDLLSSRVTADQTRTQRSPGVMGALQRWSEAPVPPISRNLFAVRVEYFPVDGSRTAQSALSDEGFWSRLEKSMLLQADQRDKQENLRANFMAQAAKLRIQSTMMGPQPRAMVNGNLVGKGSVVAGFRVIEIEARRIIVEREGIRLEIQMK